MPVLMEFSASPVLAGLQQATWSSRALRQLSHAGKALQQRRGQLEDEAGRGEGGRAGDSLDTDELMYRSSCLVRSRDRTLPLRDKFMDGWGRARAVRAGSARARPRDGSSLRLRCPEKVIRRFTFV